MTFESIELNIGIVYDQVVNISNSYMINFMEIIYIFWTVIEKGNKITKILKNTLH